MRNKSLLWHLFVLAFNTLCLWWVATWLLDCEFVGLPARCKLAVSFG